MAGTLILRGVTTSVGGAGDWVTVTITGDKPATVTVMFATRVDGVVFSR